MCAMTLRNTSSHDLTLSPPQYSVGSDKPLRPAHGVGACAAHPSAPQTQTARS